MPTLVGLRRLPPPPCRPVSRSHTGPEDLMLGFRLPAVVAPPPEGDLRLQPEPKMARPCNIAVDPRLCKGSVFANRRRFLEENRSQGSEDVKEAKYRVNVLRSRLESSLPALPVHPNQNGTAHKRLSLPRTNFSRKQSAPKRTPQLPVQLPQLSPGSIDKGFRKLRFVPLRNVSNTEEEAKREFPSRVVPAVGRVRVRPIPMVSAAPTPPCSDRPEYPIIETGVQTEDSFDHETTDLVRDLASSAIEQAIYNLRIEETLEGLTRKTEDIRRQLERERQLHKELEERSKQALEEKDREIRETRKLEEVALDSNKLAVETCQEITTKSMLRLKALEETNPRTRSIGMDTRQLNQLQNKVELVTAELEKDFFPWMFARAEKIFKNKWTYSQLQYDQKRRRRSKKFIL